jgi:elongation factor Ts
MAENITPEKIKELRERAGVGMTQCKEALVHAHGDMEKAVEYLRKTGAASAVKKEGRETREGIIGTAETAHTLALVEINAETDFVVKNERFRKFVDEICEIAAQNKPATLEHFLHKTFAKDAKTTIDQYRNALIQSFGENIQIKRMEIIAKVPNTSYGVYSHMNGKIVAVVVLQGDSKETELARNIAMHVVAEGPDYLKPENIPQELLKKEEEIARSQIKGKPENIIEKIAAGKMQSFYDQVCLLRQKYVKDPTITVQQLVDGEGKKSGRPLMLISFWRWKVGEGK